MAFAFTFFLVFDIIVNYILGVCMNKQSKDWHEELNYLADTQKAIDHKIDSINKNLVARKNIIEELKQQYFFEKSTHEMDTGDNAALFTRIDDMTMFVNEQIDLTTKLMQRKVQPYFGRIDFEDKTDKLKVYVGLCTIDDNKNYYVFDWRAPIGELFYEYGKGKAEYDSPQGKIQGNITLKRQYDIQNGNLLDVYDVDQNIFDNYLQKLLANISSTQLHNIAATIQQEQNKIIRDIKNDLIVVQGCVGSGKTTVALHRIAYMLYKLNNLKSDNIILFSPNELFFSHISGVLPELGEKNTHTATFARFVQHILGIKGRIENMDEFVARYSQADKQNQNEILNKLDFSNRDKIKQFVLNYVNDLHFVSGFKLRKHIYTTKILNELWQNKTQGLKLKEKLNALNNYIAGECKLDPKFYNQLYAEIVNRLSDSVEFDVIFNKYLKSQNLNECNFNEVINYEDAILLCLCYENLTDIILDMDIKQVVFDEVQEYPLLFIDFVTRLFPHAGFSMYGDDAQCTTPGAVNSIKDILALDAGYRSTQYYTLQHTYRSSEEIVEYSNKILNIDMHNAFRLKYGQEVEEIKTKDATQKINQILTKIVANKRSVGIICADTKQAMQIYNNIDNSFKHNADLIINAKDSSLKQIQILPVTMCKGLEFDTAIVVKDGGVFDTQFGKNYFYIACTRAINKLYVIKK